MIGGTRFRGRARRDSTASSAATPRRLVAGLAHGTHALHLLPLDLGVELEHLDLRRLLGLIAVDADHDRVARVDGDLRLVGRVLDLPLDVPRLDRRQRPADGLDPVQQLPRALLRCRWCSRSISYGPRERIDGVGDAGLVRR